MMSTRPSALWPCSMKFLQSASLLRSAVIGNDLAAWSPSRSRRPSPRAAPCGARRSRHRRLPCASARAMPLPIPSLPPVTSAVLPLSLRSMSVSSCGRSRTIGSAAGEARRSFFREGAAALGIVGAGIGRRVEPLGLGETRGVARNRCARMAALAAAIVSGALSAIRRVHSAAMRSISAVGTSADTVPS